MIQATAIAKALAVFMQKALPASGSAQFYLASFCCMTSSAFAN